MRNSGFVSAVTAGSFFLFPNVVIGQTAGDINFIPITGSQRVLAAVVEYPDEGPIMTLDDARAVASRVEVDLREYSYDKLIASMDVHNHVITMPQETTCYGPSNESAVRLYADIRAHMLDEHEVDIDAEYERLIIVSKKVWIGVTAQAQSGRIVLYGNIGQDIEDAVVTWAHELGHTFNWEHANLWQVDEGAAPDDPNGCKRAYADSFDTMGGGVLPRPNPLDCSSFSNEDKEGGHFGPWLKHRADWLESGDIVELMGLLPLNCDDPVPPSDYIDIASIDVDPISEGGKLPSAIRLPIEVGKDLWLYYRGYERDLEDGITLQWGSRQHYESTLLLDMDTSTHGVLADSYLPVGESFTDFTGTYSVRLLSVDQNHTSARVCVSGTFPDPDIRPIINVESPTYGEIESGTITYVATAYDPAVGTQNGDGIEGVVFHVYEGKEDLIDGCVASSLPASGMGVTSL